MTSWYEFEEIVGRRWHRWAAQAASYPNHPQAAVPFEPLKETLAVYFRALGGPASATLTTARAEGQAHRLSWRQKLGLEREPMELARLDCEHLVLPARIDLFPDPALNRDLYFWLTAFLARAEALVEADDPVHRDLERLAAAARTCARLGREFPGLGSRYRALCTALRKIRPRRRLPPAEAAIEQVILAILAHGAGTDPSGRELEAAVDATRSDRSAWQAPAGYRPPLPVPLWGQVAGPSAGSGPPRDEESDPEGGGDGAETGGGKRRAERRYLDQAERDDPLMLNPFEKMLSWAEMVNVNRHVEDDDEKDARKAADQLEHLTLSKNRKKASTRLKLELDLAPGIADDGRVSGPELYPEWDFRKRALRPDYCAVWPVEAAEAESDWQPDPDTRRRIRRVRRQFEALRSRREKLRAQLEGDEFDTDALVRSLAEQAAGGAGTDKIYTAWRDQARDLAVAILVDVSLSTDSWLDDRRVLDVEKEALMVLAHGIAACGDDQAVFTFTSHRRQRVEVTRVKDFDEVMGATIERRIEALKPGLYTRMGAAVRHVAGKLAERPNRHRLLLVLTDGKPNDTDHYEGRYAVEDTRMAVREARRAGLKVFGVTVDAQARQYFPLIFGRSGFAIVARSGALSSALPAIYRQLLER